MNHFILIAASILLLAGCATKKDTNLMISSQGATAESVYLTHDQHNNPVIVWTEKENDQLTLYYAIYGDGHSIANKIGVPLSGDVATHAEGMPKVAFKEDGSVIAAYEKKAPTKENKYAGAIYYIMSTDEGKSWSQEAFIHSDTATGRSRSYFDIERLPDGEIGASWLDVKLNVETGGRSVRFARTSKLNGFSNEILVDSSACQCCRIDVCTDERQNIFVAYRGLKKGAMGKQIRDMMIATSNDQGLTFSSPITLSADNWNIDGCPHTGPSICGNKAGLFALWYTEGSGAGIYSSQKADSEGGFSPRQLVSNEGHHPQLTTNGDQIAMLWEENIDHNGKKCTSLYYRIVKDGIDIKKNVLTQKGANAFVPVVTQAKDGFLVAYLMEKDNKVGVYMTVI